MVIRKSFLGFFVIFFLFSNVDAVGVSPPRYEVNFQSNLEQTFSFTVVNNDLETEFEIAVDGDLKEYVKVNTDKAKSGDVLSLQLNLPQDLKPGVHEAIVSVTEILPPQSISGIVVRTQMRPRVLVYVPYPGKYAEMEFSAKDAKAGQPVDFNLKIYSRGDEEIRTNSRIEIYEAGNLGEEIPEEPKLSPDASVLDKILLAPRTVVGRYVETVDLGEDVVPSQQFIEIGAKLDTLGYKSGIYKAVAVAEQSDQIVREEKLFKLGELFVEISDWSDEFERGKTDSIIIELESFWNDPIEDVYVEGEIIGKGITFETKSIQALQPFEKQRVTGYFDTSGIEEDKFQAKLTVHYGNEITERVVDLHFVRKTDYLLITLIVVLIIAGIFFVFVVIDFVFLRKKNGKK